MATQVQVDELIAKMTEERDTLLEAVAQVIEAEADVRPPEGEGEAGWSVKEQLSHLAEMEVSYRAWVQRALVEDRPDVTEGTTTDPVAVPHSEAHSANLESHVAELKRLREQTLEIVGAIPLEGFERTASTRIFGELTVLQWLRSYYRHDRMHAAQIEGRQSDYVPRWAEGQGEPQRAKRTE
jgi:hypothetical protein